MEFGSPTYFTFMLSRSKLETSAILRRHLAQIPNPARCASLDSYWLRLAQICKIPLGDFKAVDGMEQFVWHTWTQGCDERQRVVELKERRRTRKAKKLTAEAAMENFISTLSHTSTSPPARCASDDSAGEG